MIKADLARIVYETHGGLSYRESKEVVESIITNMKERLGKGENVKLTGFGTLNVIDRKGRLGRNPQTGERMRLPASKYVTFRPSKLIRFNEWPGRAKRYSTK